MSDPLPMGFGQQTMATQLMISGIAKPARKKRRTVRKKAKTRRATARKRPAVKAKRRTSGRKKKPARLVKGSAAAKRHMAKLRKMRKR